MRARAGDDNARFERLYLLASAKAQVVAAEHLLREAVSNMKIADVSVADDEVVLDVDKDVGVGVEALRAVIALREQVFQILKEESP